MLGKPMFTKNSFNLYPKNTDQSQEIETLIKGVLIFLWVGCLCFSAYTFFLFHRVTQTDAEKLVNTKKVQQAKPLVELNESVQKYKASIDKIKAFETSIRSVEAPMVDILKDLESKTPSDITINSFLLNQDGLITLTGMAKDEFVVGDFVTMIKTMDQLTNVYLKSVSKKEDTQTIINNYINIFTVECQVKNLIKEDKNSKGSSKTTSQGSTSTDNGGKQ